MAKKDDFYITTLKYGRSALEKAIDVHHDEVREYVKNVHPNMNDYAFTKIFWDAFEAVQELGSNYADRIKNKNPHVLNIEAYFHLLEHQELQEARRSSHRALCIAIFAILLSGALAGTSIWIQLSKPTNVVVNSSQIGRILDEVAAAKSVVLDRDQLEQLLKDNDHSMSVVLDDEQLDRLIEQLNTLNSHFRDASSDTTDVNTSKGFDPQPGTGE